MINNENVTGVSAKILADSVAPNGKRLTTFEITLPKVLIAELNTHRALSKNFSSTRAIPLGKQLEVDSFAPAKWLMNQAGMMAKNQEIDDTDTADYVWTTAINDCKAASDTLSKLGVHKQWAGRLNDWHIVAKGVLSGTEWENFKWLRYHEAAQPEMFLLAKIITFALDSNKPVELLPGQWHLPYVETLFKGKTQSFFTAEGKETDLDTARKIASSCCAQASYRKLDESVEKSVDIYDKLLGMDRKHASPFEHIGTPIPEQFPFAQWDDGITHRDRFNQFWSGNFNGWIQYRQLIPDNTKLG